MGKRFMSKGRKITVGDKSYTGFSDIPKLEIVDATQEKKKKAQKRAQKRARKRNRNQRR